MNNVAERYRDLKKRLLKELNDARIANEDKIYEYKKERELQLQKEGNTTDMENDTELQRLNEIRSGISLFIFFTENDLVNEGSKKRTEYIAQKDKNFVRKHPVVLNYLIDKGVFDAQCYIKYINRLYNKDYLKKFGDSHLHKCQGAYYRYLAQKLGTPKAEIKKREKEIIKEIETKTKATQEFAATIKQEYAKNEKDNYAERKARLIEMLKKREL